MTAGISDFDPTTVGRTVRDTRVGGVTNEWVQLPAGVKRLMRVPDKLLGNVVYLCVSTPDGMMAKGTGFFLGRKVPDFPDRYSVVLVTADHVIRAIERVGQDGMVHVRLNSEDGGATWHRSPVGAWYRFGSELDAAVYPWNASESPDADYGIWPISATATDEVIRREGIGIGDEVFMVGLFTVVPGRTRNEPIVRVGTIAGLPKDRVPTKVYGEIRAFLIEARSIGGLSGSPVYVHLGLTRWVDGGVKFIKSEDPFFLLGIMHGHWDTEEQSGVDGEKVNMGVGLVTPIGEVEKAMEPLLSELGEAHRRALAASAAPTEDGVADGTVPLEGPSEEFQRFEDLARKLVQVPKEEVDELRDEG